MAARERELEVSPVVVLGRISWAPAGKTSPLLEAAGVRHGFAGVGEQPLPAWHFVRQVHGTHIAPSSDERTGRGSTRRIEADGVLTRVRGETVAVKTADCLPLILVDEGRAAAIAVHAGWRGLTAGIVARAVDALTECGVPPARMLAVVGPTISRERFEVGPEVVEAMLGEMVGLAPGDGMLCVAKGIGDRWHVDLAAAAALTLARAGIPPARIEVVQACTHHDTRWHSFRREGKSMKSNWTWVSL